MGLVIERRNWNYMGILLLTQWFDWQSPGTRVPVSQFVLSAARPQILTVPPGHVTAIIGMSAQSALMVFSTGTTDQAPSDTYRFPPDFWEIPDRDSET